ncbi:MAG: Gfo/Idh/MocA family oxidoreductase [Lacipirellulaceae bacterium]
MNQAKRCDLGMDRRSFVKQSIAATALLGNATSARGDAEVAPSDQFAVAVIGAGGIARFHAANQFKPWFRIRAICEVDRARAESYNQEFAQGQAFVCSDHEELLGRKDIDAFFVCTPDHWHTKITVDALRSKKDVYCEKPLTLTVAEGQLIDQVLGETEQILLVGTQQRSDPNFQTAVALARSGRLGKVKQITVAIGGGPTGGPFSATEPPAELDWNRWLGQAPSTDYIPQRCHGNFRWWYEYSGGKMTDWGAHHVDIAQWALEPQMKEPVSIEVISVTHPVAFENGLPSVNHSYNTAASFRIRCRLATGTEILIVDNARKAGFDNGVLFECEDGRYFVNRGKLTGRPIEQLAESPIPDEMTAELRKGREPMNHLANFYWSCRERTESQSDAASHLRSLNLCHLANIAMRLGKTITWDPISQQIIKDDEATRWLNRSQREGFEVI